MNAAPPSLIAKPHSTVTLLVASVRHPKAVASPSLDLIENRPIRCGSTDQNPLNGKPRNPETWKPRLLAIASLAFVLHVVVFNLEPLPSKGKKKLVPDCYTSLSIPPPKLLHHVFWDLG